MEHHLFVSGVVLLEWQEVTPFAADTRSSWPALYEPFYKVGRRHIRCSLLLNYPIYHLPTGHAGSGSEMP